MIKILAEKLIKKKVFEYINSYASTTHSNMAGGFILHPQVHLS